MIDIKGWQLEPYNDSRSGSRSGFEGGSGPILFATDPAGNHYLIKHVYPHNAANEYTTSWLAGKLGVNVPKAYLIKPTQRLESRYAVAIEYIKGLELGVTDDAAAVECLGPVFALHLLTAHDDKMQLGTVGGRVIAFDFSEAFEMRPDMDMIIKSYKSKAIYRHITADTYLQNSLDYLKRRLNSLSGNEYTVFAYRYGLDYSNTKKSVMQTMRLVLDIGDEDIEALVSEISFLYPAEIAAYYGNYIKTLQSFITENQNSIPR